MVPRMTAASRLLTGCTDDVLANGGIFSKNVTLTTIIAGSLLAAMSCANQSDKNLYSRIPRVKTDKPVTGPTRLNLEEIRLDFPDSTLSSGRSYSGITPSGNIYYFDSYTCDMYEFGTDGTFVGKSIGYGRGPQESLVKHCDCFAMSDEGEIALFGSNLDFEYFPRTARCEPFLDLQGWQTDRRHGGSQRPHSDRLFRPVLLFPSLRRQRTLLEAQSGAEDQ